MSHLIITIACGLLALNAAALVLCKKYEDGLIGRIALVGTSGCAGLVVCLYLADELDKLEAPLLAGLCLSVALFFLRHTYRFTKWYFVGEGTWRNKEK